MAILTVANLNDVMTEAAGEDEAVDLREDALDTPLVEMGIDSLGLLEIVAIVKRTYGVVITDDELADIVSPRLLLDKVNKVLV